MKTIIVLLTIGSFVSSAFCQALDANKTPEYYLDKSKTNKNVGLILLVGGSTMFVAGAIADSNSTGLDFTGAAIAGIGVGVALTSIPFFIASSSQARKAAKLSLAREDLVVLGHGNIMAITCPAVSLRIQVK